MDGSKTWYGKVNEDGAYSILSRLTSLNGSGTAVHRREGNLIQQVDVASITCKVYNLGVDRNAESGTEVGSAPTVVVSTSIYDTLQTLGWPTEDDYAGYNFRHDLSAAYAPEANVWYLVEYKVTLTSGGVLWLKVRVKSSGVLTS